MLGPAQSHHHVGQLGVGCRVAKGGCWQRLGLSRGGCDHPSRMPGAGRAALESRHGGVDGCGLTP